jgi:hypothetical protein
MPVAVITPARTRRVVAVAAAVLFIALTPVHAEAASTTDAVCTSVFTAHITPGFSMRPGSGSVTSNGETGRLVCSGTAYGKRITGPGTFSVEETYTSGPACLTDKSSGEVRSTIPTTGGPIHIVGALTGRRLGLVEFVDIAFPRARFSGTGVVVPTRGNCLITPLTRALVSITATFRG